MKVRSLAHFLNQMPNVPNLCRFNLYNAILYMQISQPPQACRKVNHQSLEETSFLPRGRVKREDESLTHRRPTVRVSGPAPKGN